MYTVFASLLTLPLSADVDVTVTLNQCPTIDFVIASTDVYVDGVASMSAVATDKDKNPLKYLWISNGVVFSAKSSAGFYCLHEGTFDIQLVVKDQHCADTYELQVTCSERD
jgi:hypothetical protein